MKKLNNPLQFMIWSKIVSYVQLDPDYQPSRWETLNYLIGYYGAITADHIAAIEAAVREGVISE